MSIDFNASYFDLLGLPVAFAIDEIKLAENYRKLQAIHHPDRFAQADDQQRRIALQSAARINQAHEVLSNPLQRGFYLLELAGLTVNDDQQTSSDAAFLMQQMELRERLDEVIEAADPLVEIDAIRDEVQQQESAFYQAFSSAYDAANYPDALEQLKKIQFFRRLHQQLDDNEATIEDELLS